MGKIADSAGLIFKLILLHIIYIVCFCTVYGMGEYSFYPFSNYPKPLMFLFCLTVMIMFAPLVYLVYKVKKFDYKKYNDVYIVLTEVYTSLLTAVFAMMSFD